MFYCLVFNLCRTLILLAGACLRLGWGWTGRPCPLAYLMKLLVSLVCSGHKTWSTLVWSAIHSSLSASKTQAWYSASNEQGPDYRVNNSYRVQFGRESQHWVRQGPPLLTHWSFSTAAVSRPPWNLTQCKSICLPYCFIKQSSSMLPIHGLLVHSARPLWSSLGVPVIESSHGYW